MIYTIKSKENLIDIGIDFRKQGFKLIEFKDQIEIEVDEYNNLQFMDVISFYVALNAFKTILTQSFKKIIPGRADVNNLVTLEVNDRFASYDYFQAVTQILLMEYFKNMNVINIDSFITFNMKGFKEELIELAKKIIILEEDECLFKEEMELSEGEELELKDIFKKITEIIIESKIDITMFKKLDIYEEEDILFFKSNDIALDEDYLMDNFEVSLDFKIQDDVENEGLMVDILFGTCLINIFNFNEIIFHTSISNYSKRMLKHNFEIEQKDKNIELKLMDCPGCINCNKKKN